MAISEGDRLPDAQLLRIGENGPETVELSDKLSGRKVILFGLPGAYTGTCTTSHVPSFIRVMDRLKQKGVDEVICFAVNDPFVMQAWGESTGAKDAGITMLADPESRLTKAIGLAFTAPPAGFIDRCTRFAACVEDGVVKVLHVEEGRGVCDLTSGEAMLEAI